MTKQKISSAEYADNHRRFLSVTMLLLSLVYGVKAMLYSVNGEMKTYLSITAKGFAILAVISLIITVVLKWRYIPTKERYYLFTTSDSFANQTLDRACKISWILMFPFLFFVPVIINRVIAGLPLRFYIDLTLFFMFSTFSVSFLILFNAGSKD